MKYKTMCNSILEIIDKDNIQDVFCCITRLRIIVKDKSVVDISALEKIDGIIQVKEAGNQIQLVIGAHVQDVYKDFCAISGFKEKNTIEDDEEDGKIKNGTEDKRSIAARILDVLSSIFVPVIPVFVAGGMIKCLYLILTIAGLLPSDSGAVTVWTAIGDAPFYFLPFMVGCTTAKRFHLNQMFGLMIAGCLMYPTFLNQTAGSSVQFLFLSIPAYSYASTVLPTILCVIAFSYLFRFIDKFIPSNLKIVFSGMISFAIFMPILLAFVAPLGDWCGQMLSSVIDALFTSAGPFAGALFAGFMPFIVMTGMHSAIGPIMIQNLATLGYDILFPAFFVNNIAVAGATLGASFRIKDEKMHSTAVSSGFLGIIGITEPALYGIDIKYHQPLLGAMLGGAIGGALYMLLGVKCYAYAMPGIFSLAAYLNGGNNLLFIIFSLIAAFLSAFSYAFLKTKDIENN
jgi:PTS system beta-glucosides-specific IIC component